MKIIKTKENWFDGYASNIETNENFNNDLLVTSLAIIHLRHLKQHF